MRSLKRMIVCFSLVGLVFTASHASAATVNLEPPKLLMSDTYVQDGYTFMDAPGPNNLNDFDASSAYFNWKNTTAAQFDADLPGSTLDENYPDTITTIVKTDGSSFLFGGISLATIHNLDSGGTVDFTFKYADGTSGTDSVTLALKPGLQAFSFNQANVLSVAITNDPNNPFESHTFQFDDLIADSVAVSAVPLPASLPMFGTALLALGGLGYGLNRRTGQKSSVAKAA